MSLHVVWEGQEAARVGSGLDGKWPGWEVVGETRVNLHVSPNSFLVRELPQASGYETGVSLSDVQARQHVPLADDTTQHAHTHARTHARTHTQM